MIGARVAAMVGAWLAVTSADPAGVTTARAGDRPTLVYVRVTGMELADWEACDGVPGRRFIERCRSEGRVTSAAEIPPGGTAWLDRWRDALATGAPPRVIWLEESEGAAVAGMLGDHDCAVEILHRGSAAAFRRLDRDASAWLPSVARLRWEEAIEMLELGPSETDAFARVDAASGVPGALAGLRRAFQLDKGASNVGLSLLGAREPASIGWSIGLPDAYRSCREMLDSEPVQTASFAPGDAFEFSALEPEQRDAARRRFFHARVLASSGRVHARVDRIFQSIAAIAPRDLLLVIDGRECAEPWIARWSESGVAASFEPGSLPVP